MEQNTVINNQPKKNWFMKHKIITAILGFFLLMILVAACSGGEPTQQGSTTTSTNQVKTYQVNENAKVGDIRWKVIEVKDRGNELSSADSQFPSITQPKKTSGKFVQIKVEVENQSKELRSVGTLNIVDDQGRSFIASTDTSEWVPSEESLFILSNLNPNLPYKFTAIYEIPADAKGLKLKVGDLKLFGPEEAEINLGL